jgi:putative colanic acid biosynthesis acetyltransferase WcaF
MLESKSVNPTNQSLDHNPAASSNRYQDLRNFQLPKDFRGRPGWYVQLWWLVQWFLFRPSPQVLYSWRRFLLRLFGAQIGHQVLIRPTAMVTFPWKLRIGDYSWIGDEVVLYSLGEISIGMHTVISQRSYLCAGTHDYTAPGFDIAGLPIHIGDQVWIATDVFVAPGVEIGSGTVVGARSTVFNHLAGGMVCYGNPAYPVRTRPPVLGDNS